MIRNFLEKWWFRCAVFQKRLAVREAFFRTLYVSCNFCYPSFLLWLIFSPLEQDHFTCTKISAPKYLICWALTGFLMRLWFGLILPLSLQFLVYVAHKKISCHKKPRARSIPRNYRRNSGNHGNNRKFHKSGQTLKPN